MKHSQKHLQKSNSCITVPVLEQDFVAEHQRSQQQKVTQLRSFKYSCSSSSSGAGNAQLSHLSFFFSLMQTFKGLFRAMVLVSTENTNIEQADYQYISTSV